MAIPSISVRLTCRDILALPNDLLRHELIDGEHIVSPAPGTRHQVVLLNLASHLHLFVRERRPGSVLAAPFDVVLSEHDIVEPDLIYLSAKRARRQLDEKRLVGPPELAVEVLSPSTRRLDETRKLHLYERFGVGEYWLVDPDNETIRIHRLVRQHLMLATLLSRHGGPGGDHGDRGADAQDLSTPLLPGLAIPLAAIFE
jgi:Uma2 family endonuclease